MKRKRTLKDYLLKEVSCDMSASLKELRRHILSHFFDGPNYNKSVAKPKK